MRCLGLRQTQLEAKHLTFEFTAITLAFSFAMSCWPTQEEIDNGYPVPKRDRRRRCPPDIGFILTGDVCEQEGFVISWAGGTVRGSASGSIMSFYFDHNREHAAQIKCEIEKYYKQERW